jgi:hypothetical protein
MWVPDYDGDGEIEAEEELRYNDEALEGRYFTEWSAYDHPSLGAVEIGGWHRKFWGQNPPAEHLGEETVLQLPWILYLAEQTPRLELSEPTIVGVGQGIYTVQAQVRNVGFLPTSLTGRGIVGAEERPGAPPTDQVVRPVYLSIHLDGAELTEGTTRVNVGHLAGTGPFLPGLAPSDATVTWRVRATGPNATIQVRAASDKAGVRRSEVVDISGGR